MTDGKGYKWGHIGARIREARKKVGLTQKQIGERVGVNEHTVWFWEAGRSKPSHEHLVDLAFCCEVSTDWLLGRESVEAGVLDEAEVSFRAEMEGLPVEDLESIREFIRFVRHRRREKDRRVDEQGASQG